LDFKGIHPEPHNPPKLNHGEVKAEKGIIDPGYQ
jgi:hypothetical protein